MDKDFDCIVYMKLIQLEVTVPVTFVWEFMFEFGEKFAFDNIHEGGKEHRPIEGYHAHPSGWHIKVLISPQEEGVFYQWFDKFCKDRELTFRGPKDDDML